MALTREERQTIETIIKKVRNLERTVEDQQTKIDILMQALERIDSLTNMANWSEEQWRRFLKPHLASKNKSTSIQKHNHTNGQTGGDCFAKLGANLINGS